MFDLNTENDDAYTKDVNIALNNLIKIGTHLEDEDNLSNVDKSEFDYICELVRGLDEIETNETLQIGELVIYKNLPYMILEIDIDDVSICIGKAGLDSYPIDVSPLDLLNENN